jgi:peptidoglycan L-alanyl-D-glutamate endopeptidase CwlK
MTADRDLSHIYPEFAAIVAELVDGLTAWCAKHHPECKPIVTEGFRSVARQQELYALGRTAKGEIVTQKNGTTNRSNHQSGLAVDFALVKKDGGLMVWDDEEFWQYLGHLARAKGMSWGGSWKVPVDKPHVEWPTHDIHVYQKAAEWKATVGLR